MPELFNRAVDVTVNTTRFTQLDCAFKIEKSLKSEPNTCELRIYNLNAEHRSALEQLNPPTKAGSALAKKKEKTHKATRGIPVKIEAGYEGNLSLLWLGDLRSAKSLHDGSDWITVLESGDGEKAWQNARMNVSYGPKTPVDTVIRAMVRALGVGEGNLSQIVHKIQVAGAGKILPHGTVISGRVARELTDWCRSCDLEWSIQDGALQIIDRGKALAGRAIKLSSDTGLVGSPTVDIDGILTCKMKMIPDVRPGTLIVMNAERLKGAYRIQKASWSGDTSGGDWDITVEAQRY